jgi:hypothetical protein
MRVWYTRPIMKLVLAAVCVALTVGCGSSSGSATTSGGNVPTQARIRQLEAIQTQNPDWIVRFGDDGNVVATTRHYSVMREDIRPEVDTFARASAAELGLNNPATKRVVYEPDHVRWERPGAFVDARLRDGAIVVTAPLAEK